MNVITAANAADRGERREHIHNNDDNNITAYASAEEASQADAAALIHFDSQVALAKVSVEWPLSRFVEIWNGIPGQSPVKKFQDRKKAVARVWNAIQPLAVNVQSADGAAEKLAARDRGHQRHH